jgi:hypothetical protein
MNPAITFILTDGYGDQAKFKNPASIHWILTENNCKSYIPEKSKIINISRFKKGH